VLWCASALAMAECIHWYQAQPYALPSQYEGLSPSFELAGDALDLSLQTVINTALLILPVLLIFFCAWRKALRAPFLLAAGLLLAGAVLAASLWWFENDLFMGNVITATGFLGPGVEALGLKPAVLPAPARIWLAAAFVCCSAIAFAVLLGDLRRPTKPASGSFGSPSLFAWLYLPPAILYFLAILYRYLHDGMLFDRYLIPLLPALVIPLLWYCQQRIRPAPPTLAWAALGLFACYGIAATHDYLAAGRARVRAASDLIATGVPRSHITAGLEYDGWTELEHSGHVNDEGIRTPPGAYHPQRGRRYAISPPYWFWDETPSVEPLYFVVYSRQPGLRDTALPPVRYTAWLPPFHRRVFLQMAPAESR